jgi:hypothetical protein
LTCIDIEKFRGNINLNELLVWENMHSWHN